jgi:hypothetical protein
MYRPTDFLLRCNLWKRRASVSVEMEDEIKRWTARRRFLKGALLGGHGLYQHL